MKVQRRRSVLVKANLCGPSSPRSDAGRITISAFTEVEVQAKRRTLRDFVSLLYSSDLMFLVL